MKKVMICLMLFGGPALADSPSKPAADGDVYNSTTSTRGGYACGTVVGLPLRHYQNLVNSGNCTSERDREGGDSAPSARDRSPSRGGGRSADPVVG